MKKINIALNLVAIVLVTLSCNGPTTPPTDGVVIQTGAYDDVLPLDRVRLKPSPRAIITWNGQSPKDTSGAFWDLGQIAATRGPNDFKVEYMSADGNSVVLLQIPSGETDVAQMGAYSYRFIDNTQNDQIVIFYSADAATIKPYVFNVLNDAPYIEPVNFEPPHAQIISPIPYFNFYCESLKVYSDDMYRDCISTFKYSQNHMTLEP